MERLDPKEQFKLCEFWLELRRGVAPPSRSRAPMIVNRDRADESDWKGGVARPGAS